MELLGGLQFEWPWVLAALPLPWLVRRLTRAAEGDREAALRVPFFEDFAAGGQTARIAQTRRWPLRLAALAWALLVAAAARPLYVGEAVELPVSGRDLMMAVDLSGSMEERDFELRGELVDRLTAVKHIGGEFIDRRAGDRIGLILFGERAYLQTPLTFDRQTVHILLDESVIGLAGKATAIGDAIGLAVKRLRRQPQAPSTVSPYGHEPVEGRRRAGDRVLILLTDGANTAGEIDPLKAAQLAAREGLRIHTIGIGADELVLRGLFGPRRVNPSQDLDEKTLRAIAAATGGRYFRARDSRELEEIYALLDEIEPAVKDARHYRPVTALFHWPLALALVLSVSILAGLLRGGNQA